MRLDALFQFSVATQEVPDVAQLTANLEKLARDLEFEFFCVFHQPKPLEDQEQLIIAANWPAEWIARYAERKYLIVDPTVNYLLRANRPFSWKDALAAYSKHPRFRRFKAMMNDARTYGMALGYSFPIYSRSGLIGGINLAGRKDVELSPAEVSHLHAALTDCYFRYLELQGNPYPMSVPIETEVMLTRREIQVIYMIADGMTSNEISAALNIKTVTIEYFVTEIVKKLGVENRTQAAAQAIRLGLIT